MNNTVKKYIKFSELLLCTIIIIFGIFLRTKVYLADLSFWVDEEALILNGMEILKGNEPCFRGLAAEYSPPVFFFFARIIYSFFGLNEMALRGIPYIASIITLPLFAILAKKVIKTPFLFLFPLFYIAINDELIFNSQYFKFYSTDFLSVVAISLFVFCLENLNKRNFILCLVFSAIFAWSGFNPIFYLSGISACMLFYILKNSTVTNLKKFLIFVTVWSSLAGLYVWEVLTRRTNTEWLKAAWAQNGNFFPHTMKDFSNLFEYHIPIDVQATMLFLFLIVCLCGLFLMIRKFKLRTVCFISPIFIMLILAAMNKFPFITRQTLCLMPVWLLLVTKSVDFSEWKSINKYLLVIPTVCTIFLTFIFKDYNFSYIKQIIDNPDYCRMSTGREFYQFLKDNYEDNSQNAIYSYARSSSLRLYDNEKKMIRETDIFDEDDFYTFLSKVDKHKKIHIYVKDYPYIGTNSSQEYSYVKQNFKIIKEVDDGQGKYVIFKKQ